jgi:type IV pilus assembly protein PilX
MMIAYKRQQGIVLVVSLVILVLVTLLSVSSMKNTVLQEKMTGNYKERNSAFQAAEAGLRGGENYLLTTSVLPIFDSSTAGLYQPTSSGNARWDLVNWLNVGEVVSYTGTLTDIATTPKYILEEIPPVPSPGGSKETGVAQENKYYRVTSQAVGNTNNAVVILQSTYKR